MIRAYIQDDFACDSVRVAIVRDAGDHYDVLRPRQILRLTQEDGSRFPWWEEIPNPAPATVEPTMRLGGEEARALLDALTRHFHGAEDTRALRRDYDAERKRVDGLIAAVTQVAGQLADGRPR